MLREVTCSSLSTLSKDIYDIRISMKYDTQEILGSYVSWKLHMLREVTCSNMSPFSKDIHDIRISMKYDTQDVSTYEQKSHFIVP